MTATSAAPTRPQGLKRKRPVMLTPVAHNQSDERGASASQLPLEVVFRSRFRRVFHPRVSLSGWNPHDVDLRLFTSATGGSLESLTLGECSHVSVEGLRRVLPSLPSLKELSVQRCSGLTTDLIPFLPPSLTALDMSYCDWLDDVAVRALVRRCPALQRVSLAHCRRLSDYGVSAFADAPKPLSSSSAVGIAALDFSHCSRVTDTTFLALLLKCPRLQSLTAGSLSSFEGLTLQSLQRVPHSALRTLDLTANVRMHPLTVTQLTRVVGASLVELNVSQCAQITDETLVALGRQTPRLRVLRLAFCVLVTDVGLTRLVEYVPTVESDAEDDAPPDDATLSRCQLLTSLDLNGCYRITSDGLSVVARHCSQLTTLLLDGVRRVDAQGMRALATHCLLLRELHWSGILIQAGQADATKGFFSVPIIDRAALRAIGSLPALETLHLATTQCDTDALTSCLEHCGAHLIDLNVTAIVTDALCRAIGLHCPRLRVLRLSRSRYFSEESFVTLVKACTKLRVLDVESCEQLRDRAIVTLSRRCHALERLSLTNNWQLTDSSVEALAQGCPSLVRLSVRHCPEISLHALRSVAGRRRVITASIEGLTPKAPAIVKYLRQDHTRQEAAFRLTRWLRVCMDDRGQTKSALERTLRHLRRRKRAVIRIQRCFRRFSAYQKQKQIVLRARQEQQRRTDENWTWLAAYVVVCRLFRAYLRKWLVLRYQAAYRRTEELRMRRERAASDINRVYRGWRGRLRAREAREAAERRQRQRQANSLVLQRVWRGTRGRVNAAELRKSLWQRTLTRVHHQETKLRAAMHITRVIRGFIGRRRRRARIAFLEALFIQKTRSAECIQRTYRAYRVQVWVRTCMHRGATALQCLFRGLAGRRRACGIVLDRAYVHPPRLVLSHPRSIFTLALATPWKRKRDAAECIATTLQRCFRGYFYGRLLRRLALAERTQRWYERDHGARVLQHFFRSLVILKRLKQLQQTLRRRKRAATKIQSVWRMWTGKVLATAKRLQRTRRQRHAATLVELKSHPADQARRRLLHFGAIHMLVWMYRTSLLARGWLTPSHIRMLHLKAARIQGLWRGHVARRYVTWLKDMRLHAARMLQRAWRVKLTRIRWRALALARQQQRRLQDEMDRAARVARKLTGQFALDAAQRDNRHAALLQQWYRTLKNRQIFKQAQEVRDNTQLLNAREKLQQVVKASTESVIFQARVWRDVTERKKELSDMEDETCLAMGREIAALKQACLEEYVAHVTAATEYKALLQRKADAQRVKRALAERSIQLKKTIQPFAEQAKTLTMHSARVHVTNKQLQHELRRVHESVARLHSHLRATLPLEPLLYDRDVDQLLTLLGLPGGKRSLLAQEVDSAISGELVNDSKS
ncbi:hypothetical protein Poli38472_009894 [Pythium oligandrum]|uniref:Uncharacterized protein n=1 Tax=Pythium oligandrum TaxID=41045 RepID=A0A8K1FH69_PYTOL|nr:hypothetical protein Poli38472_009894 [Pythium oligandrum]|eukprot:TMW62401.1 hypothetical protein Poli38472_009894 [Pythium oligandrum]